MNKEKIFKKYNKWRKILGLKKLTKKQKSAWIFFDRMERGKVLCMKK